MKPLKMYILVKKSLDSHKMLSVAHASLMCHDKFYNYNLIYNDWFNNSFRKVVCEVTDADFERFKKYEDKIIVTEDTLQDKELAMAFCPRHEWPKDFQFLSLSKY